jgi:hypothetical protein
MGLGAATPCEWPLATTFRGGSQIPSIAGKAANTRWSLSKRHAEGSATPPGALFLQEPLTLRLTLSLVLVSIGIYVVNRK